MNPAKITSLVFGVLYLLISLNFLTIALRNSAAHKNLTDFVLGNYPVIAFLPFALLNLFFWNYLRTKEKEGKKVNQALSISIILVTTPFIIGAIFIFIGVSRCC